MELLKVNAKRGGFPHGAVVKILPAKVGDKKRCGFDPWVRKMPGVRNGNPLQYSCLENSMDGGACWATCLAVTEDWKCVVRNSNSEEARISEIWGQWHQ